MAVARNHPQKLGLQEHQSSQTWYHRSQELWIYRDRVQFSQSQQPLRAEIQRYRSWPGATIDSGENATRWGLNNSGDSGASAPQSSKGNLTEPVAKSDSLAVSPDDGRWLLVKNRLASVLGTGIVASWFEGLQLQRLTLTEVVMTAPSKFVKQYIENGYLGDRLLDAWRSQVPLIERVSLVVAVGSTVVV